ncbi:MAG: right-handed parallel beta-helix repeat-containing protein [bacterium]
MKANLLVLVFLIVLGSYGLSKAQIIHVPADQPTIQAAISAAENGDTVLVAENTYYENIRFLGKAITVASEFIMDSDSSHILNTIIDGSQALNPDSAATVMFINDEDTTSILSGFTITGGSGVFEKSLGIKSGGGIFGFNSGATISDNLIKGNQVESDSGGGAGLCFLMYEGDHWAVIDENVIRNNISLSDGFSAFGAGMAIETNAFILNNIIEYNTCTNSYGPTDGGGIEIEQFPGRSINCVIRNNMIRHNETNGEMGASGSGITVFLADSIEISDNHIVSNRSISASNYGAWGGGIYGQEAGYFNIYNNTIENNICESFSAQAGGGGINLFWCGKTTIRENEVFANSTYHIWGTYTWGAGIMIDKPKDTIFITRNKISENICGDQQSGRGGGICLFINTTDTLNIAAFVHENMILDNYSDYGGGGLFSRNISRLYLENNLFRGNESQNYGGALMMQKTYDSPQEEQLPHPVIVNNTLVENRSGYGGAVYSIQQSEFPVIFNSIFYNNSADHSNDIYSMGGDPVPVYNNIIDTSGILTPWTGEGNLNCDPSFMPDTLHLDWNSDCLDAGIESLALNDRWRRKTL